MSAEYPPAGGVTSVAGKTGAVSLVKGDVGLGNVDNTSDANKPVSTATQTALDLKLAKASNLSDLADAVAARLNLGGTLISTSGTHAQRLAAAHVANRLWRETDTNLHYLDDGTNWILWKADGAVIKTGDETVNNSNTLQNDDHLFFPIEANEIWFAEALLRTVGVSINADFKFGWTGPAGATASWAVSGVANTSTFNWSAVGVATAVNPVIAIGGTTAVGALAGEAPILIAGWFFAGANAGTINFQWAQNTPTAENSVIKANSFLRLRRLA